MIPVRKKYRAMTLPGNETEDDFHVAVAHLLTICLLPPTTFTTFPAGYGKLSKATAGKLKAKGLKAGFPDIMIFARAGHYYSRVVGLELKTSRGSVTSKQRTMHAALQAVGVQVFVVRSLREVMDALNSAGIAHRSAEVMDGPTEQATQMSLGGV